MSSQSDTMASSSSSGTASSNNSNSSSSGNSNNTDTQEISLTARFSEQMAQLCMAENYSDVTFIVEGERLPAHRVILAARSDYFRALLYGGLSETNLNEITLQTPLVAFKALLKYIYSGNMSLSEMTEENILDTLGLANQYGFADLEMAISDYLHGVLSLDNVCAILDAARLFRLDELTNVCHAFMDRNAPDILKHDTFHTLSQDSLTSLLQRDSFFAPEVQIFAAVYGWCRSNSDTVANVDSVVAKVRFSLMSLEELLHVVRLSGILEPDRLLDAITEKISSKRLPHRGALCK